MKSFIAFDRKEIYTSLPEPDNNPSDSKLILLIKLTHELGKFGYVLDQEALLHLSEDDIKDYFKDIIPVLYNIYFRRDYTENNDLGDLEKYLKDWKSRRKEPWIDHFYINSDFRFISESAKKVNLPIVYLDKSTRNDLWEMYKSMVESEEVCFGEYNTNDYIKTIKYLSIEFKDRITELKPNLQNKISTAILSLYNNHIHSIPWSWYKLIKPSREERRLILDKLEKIDLEKENRSDIKKLLKYLHLEEYKKLYPKVYKFYTDRKATENCCSAYATAKKLIESGNIDEFKSRFTKFLYKINEERSNQETDLMTLLYSNKLSVKDLIEIYKSLQKYELGVPRYYKDVINVNVCCNSVVSIIPTIKEFLIGSIYSKLRNEQLSGKKVYISPTLKRYEFGDTKCKFIRNIYCLGKLKTNTNSIAITVMCNKVWSNLSCYLWKGPGKIFKKEKLIHFTNMNAKKCTSCIINIENIKNKGYRYIVFDNRCSKNLIYIEGHTEFFIGPSDYRDLDVMDIPSKVRNNFGGLIDLETLEIKVLNFDLKQLQTFNGNIQEAIVRYIIPEFKFSAFDFLRDYFTQSNSIITLDANDCDVMFGVNDYLDLLMK